MLLADQGPALSAVLSRMEGARALLQAQVRADDQIARDRMLALISGRDCPFERTRFDPGHFTASGFVVNDAGRVLLIKHRRLGLWLQPGGHIEANDVDVEAAARREVVEETGLGSLRLVAPAFDLDVHTIPASASEPAHLHFDIRFLFVAESGDLAESSEVDAVCWFSLDEAERVGDESIRRPIRKLRHLIAG